MSWFAAQVRRAVQGSDQHRQVLRQSRDLIVGAAMPGRPLVVAHASSPGPDQLRSCFPRARYATPVLVSALVTLCNRGGHLRLLWWNRSRNDLAYPIEAVLAEKLVTIVARGDTTTRDRDFADVRLLAGHHDIAAANLSDAITATATFRKVELRPIGKTLVTLGTDRDREWQRLITRARRPPAIRLHRSDQAGRGLR